MTSSFKVLLKSIRIKTRQYALPILVLTIILIVLFFGLRPRNWNLTNNVDCLSDKKALNFRNPGIAYVDAVHLFRDKKNSGDFTMQMSVSPASTDKQGFRPILMMHDGEDQHQLTVWHWGASVIVMNGDDYDYSRQWPRVSARDALTPGEATFITVTSNNLGTRLFINGLLAKEIENWKATIPDSGKKLRLILGNSIYGKHGWEGKIYGLAFHGSTFSPEKVKVHYDKWLRQGTFAPELAEDLLLLYTFNECEGDLIPDQTGRKQPLLLPSRPVVLKKTFLSSPWHNFHPNRSFFTDTSLNLIGFIPLGAVICYWLRRSHPLPGKYEVPVIVAFCFLLSLSMEIIQVWIPDRTSSSLDLLLNTLGAWLGIVLLKWHSRNYS